MVSNAKKLQLCIFCWVGLRVGFFPVSQIVTPSPPDWSQYLLQPT